MSPSGFGRGEGRLRPPSARWEAPRPPEPTRVGDLRDALRLPGTVCAILAARGVDTPDAAKRFLRPHPDHLADPRLLADGVRAAARIAQAVRAGETIFVHGDYDVDGICATALLTRVLRRLGGRVVPFVPHRLRDGYDFSAGGLGAALAAAARLIVTADCGTSAHATIAAARVAGLDVVVTDHHTVSDSLPDAFAVVNPQRSDCAYPEKGLCGTGIAYRLCELIHAELEGDRQELVEYLELVALATVADLVPLSGENRVLVHLGLRRFAQTRIEGLRSLLAVSNVDPASVTSGELGYRVAPRINAAGRIGDSADALRLLLTDDVREAADLAAHLDDTNTRRRDEDRRTLEEALDLLGDTYDPDRDFGVVLAAEGWHPGVIGIVASRVVEHIHRPVVLVALGPHGARGSARSIPGFHLYEALRECAEHLDRFGGHRQAAGMDVRPGALEAFRTAFNRAARDRLGPDDLRPRLRPDVDVELGEIDVELVRWMSYLAPHGVGNPGPLLRARAVRFTGARVVGADHLKVTMRQGVAALEGIGFGLAGRFVPETLGDDCYDVLFRLERNEWRGRVSAQAKLADLRPSEGDG